MRSSVALGLIAVLTAAGCCCHRSSCREQCPGKASFEGPPPQEMSSTIQSAPTQGEPSYRTPQSYQTKRRLDQVPDPSGDQTYGHANDYTWLIGRLQRISTPTEQWKIRYAPLDEEDQWGGSMVLAPDARLGSYTDGDIVYLEGQIIAPRPSLYISGPLYRVRLIRPFGSRLSAVETGDLTE